MLRFKDIPQISELKAELDQSANIADQFLQWLSFFEFASVYRPLDSIKTKGYKISRLLSILIITPFVNKASVFSLIRSGYSGLSDAGKDSYYRMKNRDDIPWHQLLSGFVRQFVHLVKKNGAVVEGHRCL